MLEECSNAEEEDSINHTNQVNSMQGCKKTKSAWVKDVSTSQYHISKVTAAEINQLIDCCNEQEECRHVLEGELLMRNVCEDAANYTKDT